MNKEYHSPVVVELGEIKTETQVSIIVSYQNLPWEEESQKA